MSSQILLILHLIICILYFKHVFYSPNPRRTAKWAFWANLAAAAANMLAQVVGG